MRPIKFRGFGSKKLFSEEKWYYGSLIIVCGEYGIHPSLIQLMDKVIPETVGQFTGCYDGTTWDELTPAEQAEFLASKKGDTAPKWQGREIYEGDIVSKAIPVVGEIKGVVVFGKKSYGFGIHATLVSYGHAVDKFYRLNTLDKIIGNIHDNPELVQGVRNA